MTRDDFHDVIMTYIIELAEENGKMISEGTSYSTPLFDEFLMFIKEKSLPAGLKMSYVRMSPKGKLDYRKLRNRLLSSREVVIR